MGLKVLMFGWEFPPYNSGGLGTACEGLASALSSENVSITFVLPKTLDISSPFVHLKFADKFLPNISLTAINSLLKPYITSAAYGKIRDVSAGMYGMTLLEEVKLYALRAAELALSEDFDVIHAHDWLSFPAGLAAKKVSGKPLVVHVHATDFDRTGGMGVNQEVYKIEKEGINQADAVVTVSQWTKNMIVRHYGILAEKVTVVHNGIEAGDYRPLPDRLIKLKQAGEKIVLFVGRITLQKGPDYFVRAAKRVLEIEPKVYFIIAGSGDMEGQVLRQAATLEIAA